MSQACFPDPARSRALLIGASHFAAAGPDLPDIPAVVANLTALRQALTNPDTGVLRPDLCRVLADPGGVDEVGTALSELAATATDLLLVYYAGHGLVDDRGRLHLALAHTHPHRARWTAFPLELLREEIANSAAATRVLILDCCFSGRAIEAMADDQGVLGGQLEVAGTYTLTSTTANAPSHAPVGDRYTAFTGALLRALDEADPLTLDQIHGVIDRDLTARNLPRPQRRAVNTAGNLALSHGPATRPDTERADSDAVRFTRTYRSPIVHALRAFDAVFHVFYFLILILPFSFFAVVMINGASSLSSSAVLVFAFTAFAPLIPIVVNIARPSDSRLGRSVSVIKNLVSGKTDVRVRELVVDRSGLTIRRKGTTTHLAWRDIAQVGVLRPERRALNHRLPADQYTRTHVLVVRLRPEVPAPRVLSMLSDEHRQLGYLGLCAVESLVSSRQEMISALERFAGGKLVHSSRQFLDRDPRLRPEMV
ncbi:MAG: caspase family protein [Pseudonocardiaceae bacterium]